MLAKYERSEKENDLETEGADIGIAEPSEKKTPSQIHPESHAVAKTMFSAFMCGSGSVLRRWTRRVLTGRESCGIHQAHETIS